MQDSQDNTFPIPQTDNAANQVGGSVPQASNDQMSAAPMPGTTVNPTDTSTNAMPNQLAQPSQPDWATVAAQDTAQLTPTSDVAPAQPDLPTSPPNPSYDQLPAQPTTQNTDPNLANTPAQTSQYSDVSAAPAPPLAEPAPAQPSQVEVPPSVPSSNMLDLSGQTAAPAPAPAPTDYAQPGAMQAGVDVNPSTGVPVPAQTGGIPPGFGGNLGLDGMAAPVPPPPNNRKKFIIIGAVVLGFILILSLILVLASRSKKSPAVELNQEQVDQTQQATETTNTQPATIPDGFKKVDRDCYSFGVFLPSTLNFANPSCKIAAKFGSVSQYEITVTPVTNSVTDLQALVDQAKVGTITSQNDIKLNNVAAKQVIQKVNGLDQQTIVVIPDNKNYQLDGQAVNGFIINTSYNDDTAKKASETLVSTWTWK